VAASLAAWSRPRADTVGDVSETQDPGARRSRLNGIKLRALVADAIGRRPGDPLDFAPGAALRDGDDGWVYLDERPAARLGAAIAWALRSGATRLHVVAENGTGVLARRAGEFDLPITVWQADGRLLRRATPDDLPSPAPAPEAHEAFRALIVEGGAQPVVEHGVLTGEVRGLEVCRVVDDDAMGVTRLEVGVGEHDREAFQMMHGDVPAVASLARVVDVVAQHRSPASPPHPLKALGAERLIRWRLEQQPDLVGASLLAPAPPPIPRPNLKDPTPCVAAGIGFDGDRVVVVCSSGVDLDLIPYAADARLALGEPGVEGRGRLVVALPSRDRIGLVDEIAGRLRHAVSVVSVD
jgi:hypothetical protein